MGQTVTHKLREALQRRYGKGSTTNLDGIVTAAITLAKAGDMRAIEFITDGIHGKVTQQVDLAATLRRMAERDGLDPDLVEAEAARILDGE